MKVIGIIYGGKTGEHEVSCRSAASVVGQLDRSLYESLLIGIDAEGVWYLQDSAAVEGTDAEIRLPIHRSHENVVHAVPGRGFSTRKGDLPIDFAFPVLHGTFGEDGTVQGLLELVDVPYAGADVLGSAVGMDKVIAKRLWEQAGLPIVPYITVGKHQPGTGGAKNRGTAERVREELDFPVFVKPVRAGSSVGVSRVETVAELDSAVELALRFDTQVIIEKEIAGREVECSVVGNHGPRAFTPGEVVPSHGFYDYDAKYSDPDGAKLLIPARLPEERLSEIQRLAAAAFVAAGTIGMARVDFLIDGRTNKAYINEINTIPGFTNISMFSRMCGADGLSYTKLLTTIIELGLEHFRERRSIEFSLKAP